MSLLKCSLLILFLFFSFSITYANESQLAIQEAEKITDVYKGGIEIRTIVEDVREVIVEDVDVSEKVVGVEQAVKDLDADIRENEIFVQLSAELLFDFDKYHIKPEAEVALTKLAAVVADKAQGVVTIKGHTDSKGSENYNQDLSLKRANAIRNWLISKGKVNADFKVEGLGEASPVAPNLTPDGQDNPEGRAKNRRVEIFIDTKKV